jgi:hypothetical protein
LGISRGKTQILQKKMYQKLKEAPRCDAAGQTWAFSRRL